MMKLREIRMMLGIHRPELRPSRRRLARCHDIDALRCEAKRRLPTPVFDYYEGGADEELSLARNREAFRDYEFRPQVLNDVEKVETATYLGGAPAARLPLVCAPTGYSRMAHPGGELAVAAAAKQAKVPYSLSTVGSTSIEDVAATGHPDLWFQLYVWRDRETVEQLIERARVSGYRILELSVDVPVAGHRTRDARNGLTIPPRLSGRSIASIAAHPGYWLRMISSPAIHFASAPEVLTAGGESIANISAQFDPSLSWPTVSWVREMWTGTLLVKGPVSPATAEKLVRAGVDGFHLSNHGGRQLDRTQAPIKSVAEVRAAVGDDPLIVVDSGIRHGADLAVAIALGADAGAVGRAYLYGLMVAGKAGVEHALSLLETQFTRTLRLLGVTSVEELRSKGPDLVSEIGKAKGAVEVERL